MEKSLMIILVNNRKHSAPEVQKVLTEMGCLIKTRLGIHDSGCGCGCEETCLIVLELAGEKASHKDLEKKLSKLAGVSVKYVELAV